MVDFVVVAVLDADAPCNDAGVVELARQQREVRVDDAFSGRTLLQAIHLDLFALTGRIVGDFPKEFVLLEELSLGRRDHTCEVDQQTAKLLGVRAWSQRPVDAIAKQILHAKQRQRVSLVSGNDWQPVW